MPKKKGKMFKQEQCLIGLNKVSSEEHAQLHLQWRTKEERGRAQWTEKMVKKEQKGLKKCP